MKRTASNHVFHKEYITLRLYCTAIEENNVSCLSFKLKKYKIHIWTILSLNWSRSCELVLKKILVNKILFR